MTDAISLGLLLVGGGVILNAIANYSHSRKIQYLGEHMSRLEDAVTGAEENDARQDTQIALNTQQIVEKDAIIADLRDQNTGAMTQEKQDALAARLEALFAPTETQTGDGNSSAIIGNEDEVVAEPVTDESGEVVGGVLPDETETDSGPAGEATPEVVV